MQRESTHRPTVLFQAAAFCYGPISTTLNILEALRLGRHRAVLLGEGPAAELARRSGLPLEIRPVATTALSEDAVAASVDEADLIVSNTDLAFATACQERGLRVAVVDTLFWMWDRIEPALLDCALYVVQDFAGTDGQLERLGRPRHLQRVGPLIRPPDVPLPPSQREPLYLVSLGGCDCPMVEGEADEYPQTILAILEDLAGEVESRILLSTGERTAASLQPLSRKVEVRTLSNREHVEHIRKARAVVFTPGLTGAMEVFAARTPMFFLPPQNYSQVLQLDVFRNAGVAPFGATWSDFDSVWEIERYLPEEEAVALVREQVQRFVADGPVQIALKRNLRTFLSSGFRSYDPVPALRFRESLGCDGPVRAARRIEDLLSS